jgi:phytoene dehydrogenase-like protein
MTQPPVIVIGGGLSGLVAATLVARANLPTLLVEKAAALGGRAATQDKDGFKFNLGPHALYRKGQLSRTLGELGVALSGRVPTGTGGFAMYRGRSETLPVGLMSVLTTGLLTTAGKLELARFQTGLRSVDATAVARTTLASWLADHVRDPRVRELVQMLVRGATFTNDPERQSAGAAIEQLQLALAGSVLYLDNGWQSIVDGLRRAAAAAGVRIVYHTPAVALERRSNRRIDAVRLADGRTIRAAAAIVTGGVGDVGAIVGTGSLDAVPPPVRVATLDVALSALPKSRPTLALGVDVPLYFSVHSAYARLAPKDGAVIHVSKYLSPAKNATDDDRRELEDLIDRLQPGWRQRLVFARYLPHLTVTHRELTAASGGTSGRPLSRLAGYDNVFIAGDWVGPRGQLSDAASASAVDAATLAIQVVMRSGDPAVGAPHAMVAS